MNRRLFLTTAGATTASVFAQTKTKSSHPFFFAVKDNMCGEGNTLEEKFRIVKDLGFDGIELHSPKMHSIAEAKATSEKVGLPIHGTINAIHWKTRLSDPSAEVRAKALQGLKNTITESHALGGSSVLLVPGVVDGKTTKEQAWERSIEQIQQAIPLASKLGVHILIENVWNKMFYTHNGPNNQTADRLAKYFDEINSPWVGSYFDIGNHQKYGSPAKWIRTLGKRIVKLDAKDWGEKAGFCKLGEGDVDWPAVRTALKDINYKGWATAEVRGGKKDRLAEIMANMRKLLVA